MKRFLALLLFFPSISLAQNGGWQQPNPAGTPRALPTPGTPMNRANVDIYGNQLVSVVDNSSLLDLSVVPVSNSAGLNGTFNEVNGYYNVGTDTIEAASTTTVLNLTGHAARVGDLIYPTGGTAGNIGVQIPVCSVAANSVTLCYPLPATPSTDAITIRRPAPLFTPLEDSAHVSTDAGIFTLGVMNTGLTIPAGNGDYIQFSTGAMGQTLSTLVYDSSSAIQAASPIRTEDTPFSPSETVMVAGAVNNRSYGTYNSTNGDVTPVSVTDYGAVLGNLVYDSTLFGANASVIAVEDGALVNSNPLIVVGHQAVSAIAQTVGTTGDAAPPAMDLGNRTIVTSAPTGSLYRGCNTAVTTATTGAILAAVASNYTYLTAITCTNSGAAASFITIEDGGGSDMAVGYLAATTGTWQMTFPIVPSRTTSVNQAVQVNVATTNTSTVCCATAYTGTI